MRVTQQMLHQGSLRSLAANLSSLQKVQEQVSTGRQLNRPSDDPAHVREAVKLRDGLAELEQYLRNSDAAEREISAADAAIRSANDGLQRARELAIQGANDTLSSADRQRIAQEVTAIGEALVQAAGARVSDRYLFSGYRTDIAPYATASGPYLGDAGAIVARIAPGQMMQTNATADVVFGPALAAITALATELNAGTRVSAATISALDAGQDALLTGQAVIGARANRLASTRAVLEDGKLASTQLLSQLEDVDLTRAITELTQRQQTYEAALKVTGQLLNRSLIDELR